MVGIRIELRGEDLFCAESGDGGAATRRALPDETLGRMRGWAADYDKAVRSRAAEPLVRIGRDIALFLNEGDRWLDRVLEGVGDIAVEIAVAGRPDANGLLLLELPWELVAPGGLFLAGDPGRLFRVVRRLGREGGARAPKYRDLALLFMAAEVEGQSTLNYEQEEAGILQATKDLHLELAVEESGALPFLGLRLAQDGPFDALHISCHGDIAGRDSGTVRKGEPFLALENAEGGMAPVGAGDLAGALGDEASRPALVFLSACRTGEQGASAPIIQAMVRGGVANAIGWDGSVFDSDATRFAEVLYGELAAKRSVAHAAAAGRRDLLRQNMGDAARGKHWHLARVYVGPEGGGALCAAGTPARSFRRNPGYKEFLDPKGQRVPVATAAEFVGRRRQAQRVLRAFRDGDRAGVLIHGIGSQGKSSLAARIANRMRGHEAVVVFGRYDALAIYEQVARALPPRAASDYAAWRDRVMRDAPELRPALIDMLEGPFRSADTANRALPILLIIDDLEQALEIPQPGESATPVKAAYSLAMAAVIAAFRDAQTESRLLFTSRYTFALTDGGGDDLAVRLVSVPLPPMDETQRDKQMRAAARLVAGGAASAVTEADRVALEARIRAAAGGNPGLQSLLFRPLARGEIAAATRAVEVVEAYLESGEVPTEANAASDFFKRVLLEKFGAMLTEDETQQLRAASLFFVPVPLAALEAAGAELSVAAPLRAIGRLQGLGLIDLFVAPGELDTAAVNPLARPLASALGEADTARLAAAAMRSLYDAWGRRDGGLPADQRGLEACRLALLGDAPAEILNAAALAGARFLYDGLDDADGALDLVQPAVAALDRRGASADLHLLRVGAECAGRLGRAEVQAQLIERGLGREADDPRAHAMLIITYSQYLARRGDPAQAEALLIEAVDTFQRLGDVRSRAITMGKIADILQARGQLEEALKIRTDEELPVYERLGDVRERAVTMGKIADILEDRGQLEEALKIRTDEQLPVYERLGDVRERAVTMGKIADILEDRGQLEDALKIRTDEQLPVYERLGDVRSRALTMGKIADILQARGQLEEALKIRTDEELPVFERLGDVRERAVTMGKIADILEDRGQLEEALKIRTDEQLPVFERLGDVRSRAVTMGKIADILQARGQLEEALKIRTDEQLPVFERLGDVRERAVTMGKIADILEDRGQLEEALKIRTDEQLPVFERLGDVRSRAVTMGKIADILQARGQLEEALKIRTDEQLPVFERLGDVRSRAVTMGKIADILEDRGQLEEALKIRTDEQLPVFERLGDVRSRAVTMGKIADILQARGQLEEALKIRTDEQLPVFERLGDVRSRAVTMGKIADILQARGQLEEALKIRTDEQLPVFERLGDVRSRAVTMGKIADILQARGQLEEALKIRTDQLLPVFERLGDVRERAVTMGRIADILEARGQLEEALSMHAERLPIAAAMGDIDSIAHIKFRSASIRLGRGGLQDGEVQVIYDELAESFEISRKMGRADAVGAVGMLLGQVLAVAGYPEEALSVLEQAEDAFRRLGREEKVAQVREIARQIADESRGSPHVTDPPPSFAARDDGGDDSMPMRGFSALPGDPTLDPPPPRKG